MLKEEQFYWPTIDEWYPNFPRNTVRVSVYRAESSKEPHRICVWGADDFGMELDTRDVTLIRRIVRELPNPLTIEWLKGRGFVPA